MNTETGRGPAHYPWAQDVASGVLVGGAFVREADPLRHVDHRVARAVVAVGSNASPAVLAAKLPRTSRVPMLPATLHDVAVGHSAHVSLRGYIAAAPYHHPGARTPVVVSWLDPAALAALDATEPNYDRVPLDALGGMLDLPDGPGSAADIYRSVHGVVHLEAHVPLGSQTDLFTRLRALPGLETLLTGPVEDVCARLAADYAARERVRTALAEAGRTHPGTPHRRGQR